ncbi:hypothetical protein FA95DRAFT_1472201, partial [Auriscalpium vulgare]
SDSDGNSDSDMEDGRDSADADDEDGDGWETATSSDSEDDGSVELESAPPRLGQRVRDMIDEQYTQRYQVPRNPLPRAPPDLPHVLNVLKPHYPRQFRQQLRVSPATFDRLVARLCDDPIFSNNSNNAQIPVENQLAIALYRFGRFGNGAGLQDVANWAGIGQGTVTLVVKRVMTAVLRPDFVGESVRFPTSAEKAAAKRWVQARSCPAWRNGYLFVDGTLVPLFDRPFWYGESYFDRKSNYSLNIQIISLPNLRIVDFGYGFTGAMHDATAWMETRLPHEHATLLAVGEFVWADSAYPISEWVVAPYKK